MLFKLVSKNDGAEGGCNVNVKLRGPYAVALKKMVEEADISLVDAVTQMIRHCIDEAKKAPEEAKKVG